MTTYEWLIGDESSSDTLSTEDSKGLMIWDLYGSTNTLEYSINIDWDNDGDLDGSNEAEYMLRWACDRGRQRLIGSPGSGFEPYRVGRLTIELENYDGRFNPWNTDSPLYGNLEPGKLMEMKVAIHDSTSATGYTTYSVFTGYTTGMTQHGWNNTVTLECEDGLGMLDNEFTLVYGNTLRLEDYPIPTVLDYFTELANYPYGTDFSADDPSTDYLGGFVMVNKSTYLEEIEKLCSASLGSIACEKDGTLAYHSIYESDSSILTLTDSNTIRYPEFPNPWEYKRSKVNIDAEILSWQYGSIFLIKPDEKTYSVYASTSETFWTGYSCRYQPYPTTDFVYFDNIWTRPYSNVPVDSVTAYDDDSNLIPSSNYSVSIDCFLTKAKVEVTNSSTNTLTFDELSIEWYGLLISRDNNQYDYEEYGTGSTSSEWNELEFNIEKNNYNNVQYDIGLLYYGPSVQYSAAQRNRIEKLGNLIYNYVSTEHVFPILQMEGRYDYQFRLDVEKKVTYTSALLGISDDYRICGLSHQSLSTPQSVLTTIYLYPVIPSST